MKREGSFDSFDRAFWSPPSAGMLTRMQRPGIMGSNCCKTASLS